MTAPTDTPQAPRLDGDHSAAIHRFYQAFARLDGEAMAAAYCADASFTDPVFTLQGRREIGGMWRMLCDSVRTHGRDIWSLNYDTVSSQDNQGSARWVARYRFSSTGRVVENRIATHLRFDAQGLILDQRDHFNFHRWAAQALGVPGVLLGWTPTLQRQVQARARAGLQRYLAR